MLDMLGRQTRVAIGGCAGSGKTFLAAEKARRLTKQGFSVLVLRFQPFPFAGSSTSGSGRRR